MAVDFGRVGNDDYASRSASGFNHNAAYTALTWFKIDVDPNDYQHFIHIGGTYSYDGNTDFVGTDNDGQLFRFGCAGGASNSFLTTGSHYLTVGQWYWCALVRETSTSLKVYRGTNASDGALIATMTNNVGSRASASLMALGGYNNANINGPIGLPRIWSGTALTLAQLHSEVASYSPVITSNLWTAPAFSGANFTAAMTDLSGNARNWTRNGTDSTIVSDPVSPGSSHAASGALVGPGASIVGSAARVGAPVSHATSGALTGPGSTVTGSAARIGAGMVEVTGLDFTYTTASSGNNYSLKQALSPPRMSSTIMWYEYRLDQNTYSGGVLFCNDSGDFNGGRDVAMFVTHGCPGTFDSEGQRTAPPPDTDMFHEIAGMTSAAFGAGNDFIASNSTLVQAGETQESFPVANGTWIPRVARITTNGSTVEHENFVDWRDKAHVIRQNLATSDILAPSSSRVWIGAPPWITNGSENFRAKFFFVKQFSRPLTDAEIDAEFGNFTDTPLASDCWFSNIYPELTAGVMPDLKGSGTDHPFTLVDGDTPSGFTEEFEPYIFASEHATSGALVGPGSTVSGAAARSRAHASSGVLTGQGSTVAGTAARTRAHPASGVLTGPGSNIAGSANRTHAHPSSGALVGAGSVVAGSAARTHVHPSSGALVGQGSAIAGSADRQGSVNVHEASGSLVGPGAAVSGGAARMRAFGSSGVLVGPGAVVDGAAARVGPAVSHDTSGSLVGPGSVVSGQARNGISQGGFGFELVDHESKSWWKRKPKSLPDAVAKKKIKQVAQAIDEIAAEKIEQDEPIKQRDVRDEIAPLLAEMPGFDWRPLFRAVVEYRQQEAARLEAVAQIERIRAIERDDDDVLALLMSF